MTKEAYLEFKLSDALTESRGIDLVTMGRGEGPDCYCYPNVLLRKFTDSLAQNYAYVVMDNEAGMEHLSRRTTQNIDELLLVSDHSVKGIRAIARVKALVDELKLVVKRQSVIINMVADQLDPAVSAELARLEIEPGLVVPLDENVRRYDLDMKPLTELPDDSPAVRAVSDLMKKLLNK
jgi:CO dehydrogenase maturation factor